MRPRQVLDQLRALAAQTDEMTTTLCWILHPRDQAKPWTALPVLVAQSAGHATDAAVGHAKARLQSLRCLRSVQLQGQQQLEICDSCITRLGFQKS